MKKFSFLLACFFLSAIEISNKLVSAEQEIKKKSTYSRYILASEMPAYLMRSNSLQICASGGIGKANYLVGAVHKTEKLGPSWKHDKENCDNQIYNYTALGIGSVCGPLGSALGSIFAGGPLVWPLGALLVSLYAILPFALAKISYYLHVQNVRLCKADELSQEAQQILSKKLGADYSQKYDLFMSTKPVVRSLDTSSSELHIIKD